MKDLWTIIALQEPIIYQLLLKSDLVAYTGDQPFRLEYKDHFILKFNSKLIDLLDLNDKKVLLIHEYLHPLLMHGKTRMIATGEIVHLAQDLAINDLLSRKHVLPKICTLPSAYGLPYNASSEWYLSKLQADDIVPNGAEHFDWNAVDCTSTIINVEADFPTKFIGDTLVGTEAGKGIYKAILDRNMGSLPHILYHRRQASKSSRKDHRIVRNRYSRRLGFPYPRYKTYSKPDIITVVDTSASNKCNFNAISQDLTRLAAISNTIVYQCDAKLHQITTISKTSTDIIFSGLGGTNLQPALDAIFQNKIKSAIIYTDGKLNTNNLITYGIKLFWIIYNNPKFSYNGSIIHIVG